TPDLQFFSELKYVNTHTLNYSQPTFDFFLLITEDNPFIPPNIRQAAVDSGAFDVMVSRDNFDLGIRGDDLTRETYRGVFGLRGELLGLEWEGSYLYGATRSEETNINNRYNDRFAAALDVVTGPGGAPVCRVNVDPASIPTNADWQGWP